ncbi:MAG: XRE family transcriptional regulator [Gammaproteobacteria bacterium]
MLAFEKINTRAKELIDQELTLRDLRKALSLTQVAVSSKLHIKQEAVSRMEKRTDILISTLRSYIKSMGGELEITAKFPKRGVIKIKGFEEISHKRETNR